MARTQAADYDDRREAIVHQAARLFSDKGFNGTSLNEIASACGISKSLFYHYFGSKEDLLYAVMASHIDALVGTVEALAAGTASPSERLNLVIHRFMAQYVDASTRQKVLLNDLHNLPTARRTEIVGKQRHLIGEVELLLRAMHPSLAAAPKRARAATMLLFGMINWTHTWFHPDGAIDADDLSDMIVSIMQGGLPTL